MSMDASDILGSPQVAGCKVNPRGTGKSIMSKSGGLGIGGIVASEVARKKVKGERAEAATSTTPEFTFIAWLALTSDEVALVGVDRRKGLKLSDVLARVPRSDVVSVELQKAPPMIAKPLVVTFSDGNYWIFEVPALAKGDVKQMAAAFA
jgi:hypothetical protein